MKVLPTWLNFFGPFLSSLDLRERLDILVQLLAGNGVVQPTIYVYTSPLGNETVQFLAVECLKGIIIESDIQTSPRPGQHHNALNREKRLASTRHGNEEKNIHLPIGVKNDQRVDILEEYY